MIIKASRISTSSGAGKVASHVFHGGKNEEIVTLQGSEAELFDAMADARAHGSKFGLRHYKISPEKAMTGDDAKRIVADLAHEFGFNPACATIVEHKKPRAGGAGFDRHWHAIVPEYDAVRGRVLDWKQSFARHEKIARLAEARLGHEIVAGRFNASVALTLQKEGQHGLATKMAHVAGLELPNSAYTTTQHQQAGRRGQDLPADKLIIKTAWEQSDGMQAFRSALAEQGIDIRAGDKKGVWVAKRDGELVGAVHRLVGIKAVEIDARMSVEPNLDNVTPAEPARETASGFQVAVQAVSTSQERPEVPPTALNPTTDPVGELRETSRPTEAPAGVSRGGSGGNPAGFLGGQTAETSPPVGSSADMEAIDGPGEPPGPNATPDEISRYRKKLAEYDEKKAQAWERARKALAIKPTGGNHGASQNQANHPRRQQSGVSFPWAVARSQGAGGFDAERQARIERGGVVSNSGGSELREPSRPLDLTGADRKGGQHQSDDFGSLDGAGRGHHPHREKTDHTRIQDRRFTRTISDTLTASQSERFAEIIGRLQEAPTAESMAREQIEIRRRDIDRSLSSKPWSLPGEINAEVLAEMIQKTAKNTMAERQRELEGMRLEADKARQSVPWWSYVFGFKTRETHKAEALEQEADTDEARIKVLDHRDTLNVQHATATATSIVAGRLADVKAWEARPTIAGALEEERLLFKVSTSVSFGDERITTLLLDRRIDLAMAEERKREQAEQSELEKQFQHEEVQNGKIYPKP